MTEPRCGFTSTNSLRSSGRQHMHVPTFVIGTQSTIMQRVGDGARTGPRALWSDGCGPARVSPQGRNLARRMASERAIDRRPSSVCVYTLGTTCAAVCWKFGPPKLILRATDYIVPHQSRFNGNASSIPRTRPPFITRQQNSMWPKRQRALRR
jgi:hypothetical protein